jgi:putative sigma-54 modulation protein
MNTQVTFRHTKSSVELQDAAKESAEKFEKFFDGILKTEVVFNEEKEHIVEITCHVTGNSFFIKEGSDDFVKSLNLASDKIIRQINKWKEKIR